MGLFVIQLLPCAARQSMMIKKIQQHLLALFLTLTDSGYRKIKRSGIFDPEFYLAANPDVAEGERHPLVHYFREGWREARSPHLLFDSGFYFSQVPEIKESGVEPLLHFLDEGWRQGKKPSPFFDPFLYARIHKDLDFSMTNPLSHFLRQGWREGRFFHPYIDLQFYVQKYSDVAASGMDPLVHYIKTGRKERRQPSLFFDVSWYLDRTPVLQVMADDLLAHYALFGAGEGKSPSPVFDPAYYAAAYPDVLGQEVDLLGHYLREGERGGLRPCAWFDPAFYQKTYMGEERSSALGHYLAQGVFLGHYANGEIANLPEKPVISLIVPVYNAAAHHLGNCIRSVLYQSYPHWQLCLADDCSTSPHVRPLLEEWAAKDSRIKITFLAGNMGIAAATNAAAVLASGEYYGFLDNDDELAGECLFRIVHTISETGADLLYSDEDLIGEDGRQFSVFYKPDFNPELLLCHNYITHFVVTRRELFQRVGGLTADRAGAQDYDLFLKLSEQAAKIGHIPEVLYHWRASETSTSINHSQKEYAEEAGRQSLVAALERREIEAEVLPTELKYFYRTQRALYLLPLVSLVIYWDQQDQGPTTWLKQLIATTDYSNYEVILLYDRGTVIDGLSAYLLSLDQPVRPVEVVEGQGLATLYNLALQHCDGDYVAYVSSDVAITDRLWLSTMLEYCQMPDTGGVCARLHGDRPENAEPKPLPDLDNQSPWYYARYLQQASTLLNGLQCPQNIWSAAWECCVLNKEALDRCGGFAAADFPDIFAIHDLSFQLVERGLQIYYTPFCQVEWRADARRFTREDRHDAWIGEKLVFQKKWRQALLQGDPYFNKGKLQEGMIPLADFQEWFAGSAQG